MARLHIMLSFIRAEPDINSNICMQSGKADYEMSEYLSVRFDSFLLLTTECKISRFFFFLNQTFRFRVCVCVRVFVSQVMISCQFFQQHFKRMDRHADMFPFLEISLVGKVFLRYILHNKRGGGDRGLGRNYSDHYFS